MQGVGTTVFEKPYILLKDKEQAEKTTRVLGVPVPRQLHTTSCRVLKGELVAPIPPGDIVQRSDGQPPHNYRTLTKDSPATFYHNDMSPLTPNDYEILAGIKSTYVRYKFFIEEGRLDWATKLKKGDKVMVELPVEGGGGTIASAVIRYFGNVKTLPGVTFGVEIKDQAYFGWGKSDGVFEDEEYFKCQKGRGLFVSAEKIVPVGDQPAPQPAPRGGGKQGPRVESSADPLSGYRYKIVDRVVLFTKKGVPIHGTVKWVGMYTFTIDKTDYSYKSVGIETDVKVKASEVEAFPSKGRHFTPAKDRGAVFLSEDEVLPEAGFVEGRLGYPMGSKEKKLHLDAMNDDPDKVSDKSTPFAKEAGIRTELVRQDAAARKQIEERKKEEEFKKTRQALPDQGLNISGQEKRLRELSEERHRVGRQIQGGRGGGGDGKEGEGGWGGGVGRNWRESEGGNVPQRKEHTYEPLPGEHQGDVRQTMQEEKQALVVGSPVQLMQDPSRHGVVRWLENLPEVKSHIAGVELDDPMEGCGDGEWNGHRYFICPPGRAFFCPVTSLRPDPRIQHVQGNPQQIALQVERYKKSKGQPIERAVREAGLLISDLQTTGRTLGTGSYGEVIEVQVRGRRCAAKKLHGIFNARDVPPKERSSMTERFETECRRVLYLSHPNIIEMIGIHFDRATRLPTLVMELMDTSLRHYLESNPKSSVTLSTKYSILHDVAGGLVYLHSLPPPLGPIVHRDLTSSNILLAITSGVVAKIADLGQAKIDSKYATQQHQYSQVPGNDDHMPPEAWLDNPVYDALLDVFSFGVVMLHTLTHEWPKPLGRLKSATEICPEVERRKPYLNKISDSPLKPVVEQCLSQLPKDRPSTNDVLKELKLCIAQLICSNLVRVAALPCSSDITALIHRLAGSNLQPPPQRQLEQETPVVGYIPEHISATNQWK